MTKRILTVLMIFLFTGCGKVSITETITLETDTYISSADYSNHAALTYLKLSKSPTAEERAILKLPTGRTRNIDNNLEDALTNPLVVLTGGYFIVTLLIITKMLSCDAGTIVTPANLTSAKLVLDVIDNQEGALSTKLNLQLLSKPWWQHATWESAYYFSSKGGWSTSGGDTDPTFTAVTNAAGTNGSVGTIEFDITNYFKSLITQQETIHYGMLVSAAAAEMGTLTMASTQYEITTERPRVVAVYTGSCLRGSTAQSHQGVYYLGN